MNRPPRIARHSKLALAALATAVLCLGGATAGASEDSTSPIVGIWSFNGGQIGVQRLSDGTYTGTVVAETTFAECPHPVGQPIWTGMTEHKDGLFTGYHQWYEVECKINPTLGPTAWRVLEEPNGDRYMRVCFSHPDPGTPEPPMPTISPDGAPKEPSEYAEHDVTYGCYNSKSIAPLPVVQGTSGGKTGARGGGSGSSSNSSAEGAGKGPLPTVDTLSLPATNKCLSAKLFVIRLKDPQYDPFKTVTIVFKGHKLKTTRHGAYVTATINLAGVHGKSFTVKVKATTVLGHTLSATRTYHRCGKHKKAGKGHKKG